MEKQQIPNGTLVLVMGILSIIGCCCYQLPGIIFGIIALVYAKKATALYRESPEKYSGYGNVNAGRIMAYIGLTLSVVLGAITLYLIFSGQYAEIQSEYMKMLEEMQQNQ